MNLAPLKTGLDVIRTILILTNVIAWLAALFTSLDPSDYRSYPSRLRVTRVGACDYIEVGWRDSRGYSILHRADCPNPIHRHP